MTKQPLEYYQARPDEYTVESNGAVRSKANGQIVTIFQELNPHAITAANSRQLHALRKAQGTRSKLLGLIDAARQHDPKLELPDPDTLTDEEIIKAGGDAVRLLTKHTAITYLGSGNLRGMGETFTKLLEPFAEDPRSPDIQSPAGGINATPGQIMELIRVIEAEAQSRVEKARAIEGNYESIS
jgi:hypothetical protein